MRSPIATSLLLLSLLGGCAQPGSIVADVAADLPAARGIDALRASDPNYTRHRAATVEAQVVQLAMTGPFTAYDRGKILRAVNEWNVVLNGFVRFEIGSDFSAPPSSKQPRQAWIIAAVPGGQSTVFGSSVTLASTEALGSVGGLMNVYVDRVGRRDLGGVVMHELGHVLGLGHDSHGHLMSRHYSPTDQKCIDKAAVQAVATEHRLPIDQLNWCETNVASAAR